MPSQPQSIGEDDRTGQTYVGEEDASIWCFPGDPNAEPVGAQVARIGAPCLTVDDVEALAIYDDGVDARYVRAAAQFTHRAAVFRAPEVPCVGPVEVAAGEIDGVTATDGIAATATPPPGYPRGPLVMVDDRNAGFTTNFKLVDWAGIAAALEGDG